MENFVWDEFCVPVISYVEPQNSVRNFDVRLNSMENPRNSPKFGLSSEIKQTDNHTAKRSNNYFDSPSAFTGKSGAKSSGFAFAHLAANTPEHGALRELNLVHG